VLWRFDSIAGTGIAMANDRSAGARHWKTDIGNLAFISSMISSEDAYEFSSLGWRVFFAMNAAPVISPSRRSSICGCCRHSLDANQPGGNSPAFFTVSLAAGCAPANRSRPLSVRTG
jgi:hypothetical protein